MEISVLSRELVRVRVTFLAAGTPVDPTSDIVQFAFVADGVDPVTGDWVSGSWQTGVDPATGVVAYWAQCLIGPGGKALAKGAYRCWVKVTDNPEIPVRDAGYLRVA